MNENLVKKDYRLQLQFTTVPDPIALVTQLFEGAERLLHRAIADEAHLVTLACHVVPDDDALIFEISGSALAETIQPPLPTRSELIAQRGPPIGIITKDRVQYMVYGTRENGRYTTVDVPYRDDDEADAAP